MYHPDTSLHPLSSSLIAAISQLLGTNKNIFYLPENYHFIDYKKGSSMKNEVGKAYLMKVDHTKLVTPTLYQIMLHNDDFTTMAFVVSLLEKFFHMDRRKAADTMLDAHNQGKAVCGIYSKDCAETKVAQVIEYARVHEHPLVCSMEAV